MYEVYLGDKRVGTVEVARQGLYYRFRCRCSLSGEVICKLVVTCGGREENLGVLVPEGDGFGLETRLPVKRLGDGEMKFRVVPRHTGVTGNFVPLAPEEPFAYITRLKDAYLEKRDGQVGIVFAER